MSDQAVVHETPRRMTEAGSHVDVSRMLRGLALGMWAGFFAWLWLGGEVSRYLGPRTYWVVPVGTVLLGTAALLHLATVKISEPGRRPSVAEVAGLAVFIAPLLVVAAVPDADLGSLAAARKSTGSAVSAAGALAPEVGEPIENPLFRDIEYAGESSAYAEAIGVRDGTQTTLVGFVDEEGSGSTGSFRLTRFYVSCCAADAIPYSVTIAADGAAELEADEWVEVEGVLERRDGEFVLVAEGVEPVAEPDDPYLY